MQSECNHEARLLEHCELVKSGVSEFSGLKRYVATGSLETGKINDYVEVNYMNRPSRANIEVEAGDVLFAKMKDTEKVFLVSKEDENNIYSTGFAVLRLKNFDKLLPKYLYYYLRTPFFQKRKNKECTGATQKAINESKLKSFPIVVPSIEKQRKIVALLEKMDGLIKWRNISIKLSENYPYSLFAKIFGDPRTNPKNWHFVELGNYILSITSGSRGWKRYYSNSGAKFIRVQNLTGHGLDLTDIAFVNPPEGAEKERTLVSPRNVLISITGEVGLSAVIPENFGEAYVSQHVALLKLKNSINPRYVATFINMPTGGKLQFAKMGYGQTRPGLNLNQIKSLKIMVPPLTMQNEFDLIVKKVEQMKLDFKKSKKQIDVLFDILMQKLPKGDLKC